MTASDPHNVSNAPAVLVRGLSHTYKPKRERKRSSKHAPPPQDAALDGIDLEVNAGEIFALLGPNGSGKSTLLRILATVQAARQTGGAAGSASLFGHDIASHPAIARQQIGVVFQHPAIDIKLTAIENLRVHGKLYGLTGSTLEEAAKQALNDIGLGERINDTTESFSGGMRRRVEIAKALLTRPRLLLMDEASAGLDLAIQNEIWADLRRLVSETSLTVLMTTHLMHEAELADRVAVMSAGKVVAVDTPTALVKQVGGQVLEITPTTGTSADQLHELVQSNTASSITAEQLTIHHNRVLIEHPDASSMIAPLSESLGEHAASFRLGRPNLGDAYLKLTGQSLASE